MSEQVAVNMLFDAVKFDHHSIFKHGKSLFQSFCKLTITPVV